MWNTRNSGGGVALGAAAAGQVRAGLAVLPAVTCNWDGLQRTRQVDAKLHCLELVYD